MAFLFIDSSSHAGIVSPRGGGPYPSAYLEAKKSRKDAFVLKRAWIERLERQRPYDSAFRIGSEPFSEMLQNPAGALSGSLYIPVVLGRYANITEPPVTRNAVERMLFSGPWDPGTMKQYWREVSFGLFEVTGHVYDWAALSREEAYYTGGIYQGLYPGVSRTGEMIREILDVDDVSVDFGAFDNDGPDGVPNSGDDDGFVDVLLVVHPTYGAECDNSSHMWSHSWTYSSWPESGGQPYSTNDPAAGGGTIKIDDYIIVPALSCETGMIEIGVICHEIGHAIGLPDLYDYNGGGTGIGFWGLMGAGNWNTPASPAHLSAWSREQLGWLNPVEIGWQGRRISLRPVETSADAVKIELPTRRFGRSRVGADDFALVCGYGSSAALVRGWPRGEGYGNGWHESMKREFSVDSGRPVILQFDVSIDAENGYDFGVLVLEIGSSIDTVSKYTGKYSRRESLDLTSRLPSGPCTFTLRFVFLSDESVSDEDGYYDSQGGAFRIDNLRLQGGSLDYSADFMLDSGGWRFDGDAAEYFIIENRRRSGFDSYLKGQGMLVWHAENSIVQTLLGNSGGSSNNQCRGLVLEEADGLYNLLIPSAAGGNYGDAGDPFPGSSDNRSFGASTNPKSYSNSGEPSPVSVSAITIETGGSISAYFTGGMPAATIASVHPDTIDKLHDGEPVLDIRGSWMLYGAWCFLARAADTVSASSVEWLGEERILARFPAEELSAGYWDLIVRSGDGQRTIRHSAVTVISVYSSVSVEEGKSDILVSWALKDIPDIRGCLLYRSANGEPFSIITPDTLRGNGRLFSWKDSSARLGVLYSYRIVTYLTGGREEAYLLAGPFQIGIEPFVLNYPNPFYCETKVTFFVPALGPVEIVVYDVSGRLIEKIADGYYNRGLHEVSWRPSRSSLAGGIYFCIMRYAGEKRATKMVLFR